jgi:hypothetical protein
MIDILLNNIGFLNINDFTDIMLNYAKFSGMVCAEKLGTFNEYFTPDPYRFALELTAYGPYNVLETQQISSNMVVLLVDGELIKIEDLQWN